MAGDGLYIGCAGWSIPTAAASRFGGEGSHLERYAARFPAVEINSTFYRPHRPSTFRRWAASVPAGFRFSVKVPREITHFHRLINTESQLQAFLGEVSMLEGKLGPLLVQLPPGLPFDAAHAEAFFSLLRSLFNGFVACEPRHPTWFAPGVEQVLTAFHVARAAADPAPVPAARAPGAWTGLRYFRLHGSPTMYYSAYSDGELDDLARRLTPHKGETVWCIFDNTAAGAAIDNGLQLLNILNTENT